MHLVGMFQETFKSKGDNRGFTLMEVIVALTVAAIALTVLVHGLSRYANQYIHLREAVLARSIGSGYLTRYILEDGYVPPGYIENEGIRWELNFYEEDYFYRDLDGLQKVVLDISDAEERHIVTLQAIVYRPSLNLR